MPGPATQFTLNMFQDTCTTFMFQEYLIGCMQIIAWVDSNIAPEQGDSVALKDSY